MYVHIWHTDRTLVHGVMPWVARDILTIPAVLDYMHFVLNNAIINFAAGGKYYNNILQISETKVRRESLVCELSVRKRLETDWRFPK
ncbi:hypothetical protein WN51_03204 [Melipona quadrifasciata]|uniref:Uncharacterized protein n=1 Tax=Melipona quadrifasciata TaxID=166423 RepID=A0A0M8ZVQ9_9HYME|nr:hypothetical protein WN51_03204 [Melipona quadrifasciata]